MARFRRRRPSITRAGRRNGREYFWLRFSPFSLTLREAATATHSDELFDEVSFQDPSILVNDTRRGGPRLERFLIDFGLAVEGAAAFFTSAGSANIDLIPEFMVHVQTDQFATAVTSSSNFNVTRDNQRILMCEVPMEVGGVEVGANQQQTRFVRGRYETKSKVRLAEASVVVSWRGFFNTGDANLNGYTDWVRATALISKP